MAVGEDFAFIVGSDFDWMHEASCRGGDHELFFATQPSRIAAAQAICADCPVRIPCLVDALERGEQYGVWGGTSPEDRDRLLRSSA